MALKTIAESHLDHGLSQAAVRWILEQYANREAFFIDTVELPEELAEGLVCGLHGPIMGDAPVPDSECSSAPRGDRAYPSRLVDRPPRPIRLVTVIAGPHAGYPCVLYTAFGGPAAPREPEDPTLPEEERAISLAFWAEHALSSGMI